MVRVFSTQEFDAWERLLSKSYQMEIDQIIKQLKRSGKTGKPLGYPFFREKKMHKYRIYFLVYEDLDAILLVTISDKKAQKGTIAKIKEHLDHYNQIIRKKLGT